MENVAPPSNTGMPIVPRNFAGICEQPRSAMRPQPPISNLDPKQTYAALRKVDILLGSETTIRTSEVKNGAKMAAPNEACCDPEAIQILNSALLPRVTAQ